MNDKRIDQSSARRKTVLRTGAVLAASAMVALACSSSSKKAGSATTVAGTGSTASTGAGSSGAPANGDPTYVLKSTAEAVHNLDPVHDIDVCNVNSLADIYDMLVRTTQTGKLVPGVAASWSSPDASTFIMKLQPNVKFQDGTAYDA